MFWKMIHDLKSDLNNSKDDNTYSRKLNKMTNIDN